MIVWSGGDLPSGAAPPGDVTVTLPPGFTLPPGLSLPDEFSSGTPAVGDPANNGAPAGAGEALIATFPVPAGGVEQPPADLRARTWYIAGKNWQSARDAYLAALAARGMTAVLETPIDEDGVLGERYVVTDPATLLTVSLDIGDAAGQIVVVVSV